MMNPHDAWLEDKPIFWTVYHGYEIWMLQGVIAGRWGVHYSIDCGDYVWCPDWETAKKESIEWIKTNLDVR